MRMARVVDLRVGDLMRVLGRWEWWVWEYLGGERCSLAAWVAREGWCTWWIGTEGAQEFIACFLRVVSAT